MCKKALNKTDVVRNDSWMRRGQNLDRLPDVRDGLTRIERVVLYQLHLLQKERPGRNVPTAMLYGRVVEHVDISSKELDDVLIRMGARQHGDSSR